uniref:Uncharacterized protein n=1 Tax=Arundo donax TaxID=35708 RepID=A0A0A9BI92_ARUDO
MLHPNITEFTSTYSWITIL